MEQEKCNERKNLKQGFTLLELLVVIVIIGILASIALPQYKKAVLRAELQEYLIWSKAIFNAEREYKMLHGDWTKDLRNLSIDFPKGTIYEAGGTRAILVNGEKFVYGVNNDAIIFYIHDTTLMHYLDSGEIWCYANTGDVEKKKKICKTLSIPNICVASGNCLIIRTS